MGCPVGARATRAAYWKRPAVRAGAFYRCNRAVRSVGSVSAFGWCIRPRDVVRCPTGGRSSIFRLLLLLLRCCLGRPLLLLPINSHGVACRQIRNCARIVISWSFTSGRLRTYLCDSTIPRFQSRVTRLTASASNIGCISYYKVTVIALKLRATMI